MTSAVYEPPRLTVIGTVPELTMANTTGSGDAQPGLSFTSDRRLKHWLRSVDPCAVLETVTSQ
jgi:hypothetical protein